MTAQQLSSFGLIVDHLQTGGTVTRLGWGGDFLWLMIPGVDDVVPQHIRITNGLSGESSYWEPQQADILADDWVVL